jgi:pyruvate dehydrogenase E1 component alpha subunit
VIYVCENNLYNEYTHYLEATAGSILDRPKAFGIPAVEVDGQDVRAVHAAAAQLVSRARVGHGPGFLLCNTYRYHGHHVGDVDRAYYRSKDEEEQWAGSRDPITLLGNWIFHRGIADAGALAALAVEARDEVERGLRFALDAPFPEPSEVTEHVFA